MKWDRPIFQDVLTRAFTIKVPWFEVRPAVHVAGENIVFVPTPPEGSCVEFTLFYVRDGLLMKGWPGQRSMQTTYVGEAVLENGQTIVMVAWTHPLSPAESAEYLDFKRQLSVTSNDGERVENVGALLVGPDADGNGVFVDVALDQSEVFIDAPGVNSEITSSCGPRHADSEGAAISSN